MYWRPGFVLLLFCVAISALLGKEDALVVVVGRHEDGFAVEAVIDVPVLQRTAWEGLVDYDHMSVHAVIGRTGDFRSPSRSCSIRVATAVMGLSPLFI